MLCRDGKQVVQLPLLHLHQPFVQDAKRHSVTGSSAEPVWNVGMGAAPVGKEVAASCVTAVTL
jgi:hypothetical protein